MGAGAEAVKEVIAHITSVIRDWRCEATVSVLGESESEPARTEQIVLGGLARAKRSTPLSVRTVWMLFCDDYYLQQQHNTLNDQSAIMIEVVPTL